jgi:uncharacterized protein YeaO (DUF488 family)
MPIEVKRVYEPVDSKDGARFLVDRLWPRGLTKADLKLDGWMKDVAPSSELRSWYSHDPAKWPEFQKRYTKELLQNEAGWQPILEAAHKGRVTLLFGSKELEINNAVALKHFLDPRL